MAAVPLSDALVFFGATGDLAYKQIFPALQALVARERLSIPIIGVAKAGWGLEQLRERARASILEHGGFEEESFHRLSQLLRYVDGDYRDPKTFAQVREALGGAKRPLHYLAIPPSLFATVVEGLAQASCLPQARERFGVQGRGAFYEEVGAIRDVLQNHLLQVVGLLTMDAPFCSDPENLRDEKARVFKAMRSLDPASVVRGQFRGYRSERGVSPSSQVETFAAVRLFIDSWRWADVPFYIRSGKCLPTTATEVFVELHHPPRPIFEEASLASPNSVRFRLGPDVLISIGARAKRPGGTMRGEDVDLVAIQHAGGTMRPYERLLGDAMRGDVSLFARQETVEEAWRVVEPVVRGASPLHEYEPGTWGPREADALIAPHGAWRPVLNPPGVAEVPAPAHLEEPGGAPVAMH